MSRATIVTAALLMLLSACQEGGLSTADAATAAKERVRQSLGLSEDAALFTNIFVGRPVKDDRTLCGIVEGRRADGSRVAPRRFIAAVEPARWIKFEPVSTADLPSQPDKFVEWANVCAGQEEVR